jgi:tRNA1(Val) A37 N6-methylase TrmN6
MDFALLLCVCYKGLLKDFKGFMQEITQDNFLGGKLRLKQFKTGHRAGMDALLLAAFTRGFDGAQIIDLGAGIGTAGFALATRFKGLHLTALEIQKDVLELACQNAQENAGALNLASFNTLNILIQNYALNPNNCYDFCLFNPPFNPLSMQPSPHLSREVAHKGVDLMLWFKAALHFLHAKGEVSLIDRPERLGEILAHLKGFGAIEILPVFSSAQKPAIRVLVRAKKGRNTPLTFLNPLYLRDDNGAPTQISEEITRFGLPIMR